MDCYKMHSCLLRSPPNDSHPTDSFLHQAKKKGAGVGLGETVGMRSFQTEERYLLLSLGFFRQSGIGTWNSTSVFYSLSLKCLLVGKMYRRKKTGSPFFS